MSPIVSHWIRVEPIESLREILHLFDSYKLHAKILRSADGSTRQPRGRKTNQPAPEALVDSMAWAIFLVQGDLAALTVVDGILWRNFHPEGGTIATLSLVS